MKVKIKCTVCEEMFEHHLPHRNSGKPRKQICDLCANERQRTKCRERLQRKKEISLTV